MSTRGVVLFTCCSTSGFMLGGGQGLLTTVPWAEGGRATMALEGTPERSVDQEVQRILAAYADRVVDVSHDEVESALRAEFERWSDVRIPDYVPIFVERSMRVRYDLFGGTTREPLAGPPRDALTSGERTPTALR
jgi:hypothetical protein